MQVSSQHQGGQGMQGVQQQGVMMSNLGSNTQGMGNADNLGNSQVLGNIGTNEVVGMMGSSNQVMGITGTYFGGSGGILGDTGNSSQGLVPTGSVGADFQMNNSGKPLVLNNIGSMQVQPMQVDSSVVNSQHNSSSVAMHLQASGGTIGMVNMGNTQQQQSAPMMPGHAQGGMQQGRNPSVNNMGQSKPSGMGPNQPAKVDTATCLSRLVQLYQLQRLRGDNNIQFWRIFVNAFFAPGASVLNCISKYRKSDQSCPTLGSLSQGFQSCQLCGSQSGNGFECSFHALPRLYKINFETGLQEEAFCVESYSQLLHLPGNLSVLLCQVQLMSTYDDIRVTRKGHLRVTFNSNLKITKWEFCAHSHEQLVTSKSIQEELGKIASLGANASMISKGGRSGLEQLQIACQGQAKAAQSLLQKLDAKTLTDTGMMKNYMRCVQVADGVRMLEDLIDLCDSKGLSPTTALREFSTHAQQNSKYNLNNINNSGANANPNTSNKAQAEGVQGQPFQNQGMIPDQMAHPSSSHPPQQTQVRGGNTQSPTNLQQLKQLLYMQQSNSSMGSNNTINISQSQSSMMNAMSSQQQVQQQLPQMQQSQSPVPGQPNQVQRVHANSNPSMLMSTHSQSMGNQGQGGSQYGGGQGNMQGISQQQQHQLMLQLQQQLDQKQMLLAKQAMQQSQSGGGAGGSGGGLTSTGNTSGGGTMRASTGNDASNPNNLSNQMVNIQSMTMQQSGAGGGGGGIMAGNLVGGSNFANNSNMMGLNQQQLSNLSHQQRQLLQQMPNQHINTQNSSNQV